MKSARQTPNEMPGKTAISIHRQGLDRAWMESEACKGRSSSRGEQCVGNCKRPYRRLGCADKDFGALRKYKENATVKPTVKAGRKIA